MQRIAAFFAIILFVSTTAKATQQCTPLSEQKLPPSVRLSGKLHTEWFWGPPNFGEHPKTDQHYQGWVLRLDNPLLARDYPYGKSGETNYTLREIQIRVMYDSKLFPEVDRYVGKHVVAVGTVEFGTGPADNTMIVMWATALEANQHRVATTCVRYADQ
jgi:hypothetical protein